MLPCYFAPIFNGTALLILLFVIISSGTQTIVLIREIGRTSWNVLRSVGGKPVYPAAFIAAGRKVARNFLGFFLFFGLLVAANQVHLSCAG